MVGVATALLALATWGAVQLSWTYAATRSVWDRIAVDFAAVEVERAARRATVSAAADTTTIHSLRTTNRFVGRWEVTPVAPDVWQVRWGVGGAAGLWRQGEWLAVRRGALGDGGGLVLAPLPTGLPPGR